MPKPSPDDQSRARALLVSYAASKGLSTDPLPEWCQATARLVATEAARDGWGVAEKRWRKTLQLEVVS